jgi:hypothetical protein
MLCLIIEVFDLIIIASAIIMFVAAGIMWLRTKGDVEAIKDARKQMLFPVKAFIILFLAFYLATYGMPDIFFFYFGIHATIQDPLNVAINGCVNACSFEDDPRPQIIDPLITLSYFVVALLLAAGIAHQVTKTLKFSRPDLPTALNTTSIAFIAIILLAMLLFHPSLLQNIHLLGFLLFPIATLIAGSLVMKYLYKEGWKKAVTAGTMVLIIGMVLVTLLSGSTSWIIQETMKLTKEYPSICDGIRDYELRDKCRMMGLHKNKNLSECDNLPDEEMRGYCYAGLAVLNEDPGLCDKSLNQYIRDQCYHYVAQNIGHQDLAEEPRCNSICERIQNETIKEECFGSCCVRCYA